MKVLAFYLGNHDSNVCLYDADRGWFRYVKSERRTGIKRHRAGLDFVRETCERHGFVPDVVGYSDGDRNHLGGCAENEWVAALEPSARPCFVDARWLHVDHHLAHVLSAWPVVPTERLDGAIAVDGCGDHGRRLSVFGRPSTLAPARFSSTAHRVCNAFDRLGRRMGLTGHLADLAGKVMGAQAYGRVDPRFVEEALRDDVHADLVGFVDRHRDEPGFYTLENPTFRDWLANIHAIFERVLVAVFEEHFAPTDTIVFAGGAALNTVINDRLAARFPHLVLVPHAYDGGLSLGCLEGVRLREGLERPALPHFPFLQDDEDLGYASAATIERTAAHLAAGKIVGWLQGQGELGPRALGHRSLLVNPALPDGKDVMNRVKRREGWRPFAPSVLHARQASLFTTDAYLPHMLRSVAGRPDARARIPAVIHVDGSSRVQSVDGTRCPPLATYHALLEAFEARTGVPALLNTSFNVNGKPIVATRAEAIDFARRSAIDVLVVGDEILG